MSFKYSVLSRNSTLKQRENCNAIQNLGLHKNSYDVYQQLFLVYHFEHVPDELQLTIQLPRGLEDSIQRDAKAETDVPLPPRARTLTYLTQQHQQLMSKRNC